MSPTPIVTRALACALVILHCQGCATGAYLFWPKRTVTEEVEREQEVEVLAAPDGAEVLDEQGNVVDALAQRR